MALPKQLLDVRSDVSVMLNENRALLSKFVQEGLLYDNSGRPRAVKSMLDHFKCQSVKNDVGFLLPNMGACADKVDVQNSLNADSFLDVLSFDGFNIKDANGQPLPTGSFYRGWMVGSWDHSKRVLPMLSTSDFDGKKVPLIAVGVSAVALICLVPILREATLASLGIAGTSGALAIAASSVKLLGLSVLGGTIIAGTSDPADKLILSASIKYLMGQDGPGARGFIVDNQPVIICNPSTRADILAMMNLRARGAIVLDGAGYDVVSYVNYNTLSLMMNDPSVSAKTKVLIQNLIADDVTVAILEDSDSLSVVSRKELAYV